MRTMESDTGEDEADDHTRGGPDHDLPPSNDINVLEGDKGEDEIGSRDDETNSSWLVKPNLFEKSGCTSAFEL